MGEDGRYPKAPVAAAAAVVIHQQCVLLVQRGRPPNPGIWAVPGGKVRLGESLRAAAEREVLEETGVRVCAGEPVYTFEFVDHDAHGKVRYHYIVTDFRADWVSGSPRAGDDAAEARWVAGHELSRLNVSAATRELLIKLGFHGSPNT